LPGAPGSSTRFAQRAADWINQLAAASSFRFYSSGNHGVVLKELPGFAGSGDIGGP
jgi:hypothetical protein